MELKTQQITTVSCQDWDNFVRKVYNKPYKFQQQEGCQSRGMRVIIVPDEGYLNPNDDMPLEFDGGDMEVSLEKWVATDPQEHTDKMGWSDWHTELFWTRNFYPNIQEVANDLHKRGLLDAGEYTIIIDW